MLCGNTAYHVKLSGEDLSRYSNEIESVGLRKCPYYHYLSKKVMSQWQIFLHFIWRENSWQVAQIWYYTIVIIPYVYLSFWFLTAASNGSPHIRDRCPVCNVGVLLWPNGWMDQDATW